MNMLHVWHDVSPHWLMSSLKYSVKGWIMMSFVCKKHLLIRIRVLQMFCNRYIVSSKVRHDDKIMFCWDTRHFWGGATN